jgi:hypothetical protein
MLSLLSMRFREIPAYAQIDGETSPLCGVSTYFSALAYTLMEALR